MRLREIETKYSYYNVNAPEKTLDAPSKVANLFAQIYSNADVEHFVVFLLNNKNSVIGFHLVSKGTISETIVHPREIFKTAIVEGASSIVIAHNHPSENLTPSKEDKDVTKRLNEAGTLLGIRVLDHVIVNSNSGAYLSLREEGYFDR